MAGILIVGGGGHAKVVADILLECGAAVLGYLDDDPAAWGQQRLGLPVLGKIDDFAQHGADGLVLGIGSNAARQAIVSRLGAHAEALWRTAIHPRAVVAASASIGAGTVIAANAVVNPDSRVGRHAIINTGATVDHDCVLGDFVHIAPGSHLAGAVRVETGAFLGAGTIAIPQISIGEWAVVGAGSVVVRPIPPHQRAYGVPARVQPGQEHL